VCVCVCMCVCVCVCVCVALVIHHAKRIRPIVMGLVQLYNTIPHYLINSTIFEKVCFDFFFTTFA